MARMGGAYNTICGGTYDGQKYVCFDELAEDIEKGECLVYSFGINNDLSFEKAFGEMGCKVFAYDPTVTHPRKPFKNVEFFEIGVSFETKERTISSRGVRPFKTLYDIIKSNNHLGDKISYLKVDIEGEELKSVLQWLDSGALDHVRQFGVEIHYDYLNEKS